MSSVFLIILFKVEENRLPFILVPFSPFGELFVVVHGTVAVYTCACVWNRPGLTWKTVFLSSVFTCSNVEKRLLTTPDLLTKYLLILHFCNIPLFWNSKLVPVNIFDSRDCGL